VHRFLGDDHARPGKKIFIKNNEFPELRRKGLPDMILKEVDKVEVLTLQDNFIDLVAMDGTDIIHRASPLDGLEIRNSVLAEHGFSSLIMITSEGKTKAMIFDFGFSEHGAAYNARILGADMNTVDAVALSHGHSDHTGGFEQIADMISKDKRTVEFVAHPGVFTHPRYLKYGEDLKVYFPRFSRELVCNKGFKLVETKDPYPILDGNALFLGEIPRLTDFEKGFPIAHYEEDGVERQDPIADDTSVAMNLKGKGLVIVSGCAHAGIINTIHHAKSLSGMDMVHAVLGGFHLSGPLFESIIDRTIEELKRLDPRYIVPAHCTGRKASLGIEREMPDRFILNMSGTKLIFSS
jgi:7,8-dihydropterin-6-yl-methyl-4-(beta-D-ribofuranosyl)aminobenzene 5'-phosphate synthase